MTFASRALVVVFCAAAVAACGEDHSLGDGGSDAGRADAAGADAGRRDAGQRCVLDAECDDGVYCNGAEDCDPISTRADALGCVPGNNPCIDGLLCTIEPDPACDEAARTCGRVTYDHGACPKGAFCLAVLGCTAVSPCPPDGSPCPDDDGDPCRVPTCDRETSPPLCLPQNAADDTPCTGAGGTAGICRRGTCCTTCS